MAVKCEVKVLKFFIDALREVDVNNASFIC